MNSSPTQPLKTNPPPNFFSDYSVVLSVPLKDVYTTLGTTAGHERVCKLSKLCSGFELLEKDAVELPTPRYPEGNKLKDVGVRTAVPTDENGAAGQSNGAPRITRQHFTMEETVPLLFGMFKSRVLLKGTLSWDESVLSSISTPSPQTEPSSANAENDIELHALYETMSDGGIIVWKLRTFTPEAGDPTKTRVTERIEGWAPMLLRPIVQSETLKGHRAHMEQYHTLF
ncbi:hypothetical protein GALMADRAFT_225797 [Galerina marginata CBS 339.88]|uniref:Uncharacterized protein n=1 Tax=Galerina marginata (strain CBS 339.88) TaxID=685588 RepID=A0A067SYU0_GALM3|nr:hypothetical protein GALMADRAFT_225797 [Galerina marginata CBS 339.88]